jgi:hypothetical protein
MASFHAALRFFRVVRPVASLTRMAFAVITAASALALLTTDVTVSRALLPILVLQMFATSTGFISDARRGHFDVLLTGGVSRLCVAVTYWMLSSAPGWGCWAVVTLVDLVAHGRTSLLAAGSLAAMIGVSSIPWATTVPLPRFAGAIGWLLTLVLVTGLTPVAERPLLARVDHEAPWLGAVAFVLFPARLVGQPLGGNGSAILVMLTLAALGMGLALWWISDTDFTLETGQ